MKTRQALRHLRGEDGFALAFALLLTLAVAALVVGSLAMASSSQILTRSAERESVLSWAADSGLEWARVTLNDDPSIYPDSGYVVLEDGAPVLDAAGNAIPGTQRWIYAGPSGVTSGQFGVFGMVVTVVRDGGGGVVIRRGQLYQESFARFAYFTDLEQDPGGTVIRFTNGDQLNGPVHSNDNIQILNPTPIFLSEVRSAGSISPVASGDFRQGFQQNVPRIELPGTAELDLLRTQAQIGGTYFNPPDRPDGLPTLRLEFLALDLDGDGQATGGNEGFFRAFELGATQALLTNGPRYLMAQVPLGVSPAQNSMFSSPNCGRHPNATAVFEPASAYPGSNASYDRLVQNPGRNCFLGGDPRLYGTVGAVDAVTSANASSAWGTWLPSTAAMPSVPGPLSAVRGDGGFLFPTTRDYNPDFKGVIFVDGSVAISGRLRGRVTVAATGHIYFADDLTYETSPGSGTCQDILGVFSQDETRVADNARNHRVRIPEASGGRPAGYVDYGNPNGTTIDGIVLALESFTTENFQFADRQSVLNGTGTTATPTTYFRDCEASAISTRPWARGCLYLTGGIIQRVRGPVAQLTGGTVYTGYAKRYDYDQCGATQPPPYFPTTGRFFQGQVYNVDPVGFDIDQYWATYTAN